MKNLIESKIDVNCQDRFDKSTVLHHALGVSEKRMEMINLLLNCDADVNIQNSKEASPFKLICTSKDFELIDLFLQKNASVNSVASFLTYKDEFQVLRHLIDKSKTEIEYDELISQVNQKKNNKKKKNYSFQVVFENFQSRITSQHRVFEVCC